MSDNSGSTINAFLLGLIAGGVLGVLFAPDKGEETRQKLKKNYKEWYKKALEVAEELQVAEGEPRQGREEVEPKVEQAAQMITPIGQEVTAEAREITQPYLEKAQEAVGEGLTSAKQELDRAVSQARVELKKRVQRSRPRFFKGV